MLNLSKFLPMFHAATTDWGEDAAPHINALLLDQNHLAAGDHLERSDRRTLRCCDTSEN